MTKITLELSGIEAEKVLQDIQELNQLLQDLSGKIDDLRSQLLAPVDPPKKAKRKKRGSE